MATTIETGERDFLQNVPPNIVEFHDEKQSTVIRWKINGVPQSKIIETNLDHLNGGHLIIDEIFDSFPTFVRGLDKTIVHQEFHLHDDPEMITDDYSAGNKDAKTTRYRRWESERIAFALLTSKENIPDKNLRQKIRILYKRYNDYRPDRWKLPPIQRRLINLARGDRAR